MTKMNTTTYDICGQEGAHTHCATRSYGKGKQFLLLKTFLLSAVHSGESYMTAETRHEIERIKLHKHAIAVERIIPVAEFA